MLVLSRRPNEKILFPSVGISVEIIQTKGNTVRVGIEAPKSVRILRAELHEHVNPFDHTVQLSNDTDPGAFEDSQLESIQSRIDEIALAIALAQNQQRQGLTDNVDVALEQAAERLQVLKESLNPDTVDSVVCEPATSYLVRGEQSRSGKLNSMLELSAPENELDYRFEFEFAIAN